MPIRHPELGGWVNGMNNLKQPHAIDNETLRNAVNFDVDDDGNLKLRQGSASVYQGTIVKRTFWSNGDDLALFVEGTDFKRLNADFTATTLRAGVGNTAMSYVERDGIVYYSNSVVNGKVVAGVDAVWGVPKPGQQPELTVQASGGHLVKGFYQVAITFVSATGEESGTGASVEAEVTADDGALVLSAIPDPGDVDFLVNVYVTGPSGGQLYFHEALPSGFPTFVIRRVNHPTEGALLHPLETQFGEQPPPGHLLEYHNGRIYIAQGNVVWATEPQRLGLVKPAVSYWQFPERVTVLQAVVDGMYVASDVTYFLGGIDTDGLASRIVLEYGAVEGTGLTIDNDREAARKAAWFSHKGFVVAGPSGDARNVTIDRIAVSEFQSGTMLHREHDGVTQLLATLEDGVASKFPDKKWISDEVARRGSAI
ncbi:MAG: hypothetical protein V3V08_11000 [Nannocystaceae bacterium]